MWRCEDLTTKADALAEFASEITGGCIPIDLSGPALRSDRRGLSNMPALTDTRAIGNSETGRSTPFKKSYRRGRGTTMRN